MEVFERFGKFVIGPFETKEEAETHIGAQPAVANDQAKHSTLDERFENLLKHLSRHGIHAADTAVEEPAEPAPAPEAEEKEPTATDPRGFPVHPITGEPLTPLGSDLHRPLPPGGIEGHPAAEDDGQLESIPGSAAVN